MNKLLDVEHAVHLCLDMQKLFGPGTIWSTPWMAKVLPRIVHIAERFRPRNVFTRFIPPMDAADCGGTWQIFYRKWGNVTRRKLPSDQLELMPSLQPLALDGHIFDKSTYSAFHDGGLHAHLRDHKITSLVVTGAETDICVLSTVMQAIDYGYRVVLVQDALCSSSDSGHDALMKMYRKRLSLQLELTTTGELLESLK